MLIFFPWDLFEFYCKVLTWLLLNKAELLFHLSPFGFVVSVDMSNDNLGVATDTTDEA